MFKTIKSYIKSLFRSPCAQYKERRCAVDLHLMKKYYLKYSEENRVGLIKANRLFFLPQSKMRNKTIDQSVKKYVNHDYKSVNTLAKNHRMNIRRLYDNIHFVNSLAQKVINNK